MKVSSSKPVHQHISSLFGDIRKNTPVANPNNKIGSESSLSRVATKGLKKSQSQKSHQQGKLADDELQHEDEEQFGVRSYLHNFYESVTVKNPQLYEDIYEENSATYLKAKRRRFCLMKGCWRLCLICGALMLLAGVGFLMFGYLMPRREVVAGFQEDMELIDSDAKQFNDFLNLCRVVGLGVFCGGGGVFCLALLSSILINLQFDDYEDDCREVLETFEIVMVPSVIPDEPTSPTDRKVPATEELASIQPKRQDEETMVMTNSGLYKATLATAAPSSGKPSSSNE